MYSFYILWYYIKTYRHFRGQVNACTKVHYANVQYTKVQVYLSTIYLAQYVLTTMYSVQKKDEERI